MLATCICLNGSLLDQLSCTIVYLHNLFTCTFGRINMSVCLSVCHLERICSNSKYAKKAGHFKSKAEKRDDAKKCEFTPESGTVDTFVPLFFRKSRAPPPPPPSALRNT